MDADIFIPIKKMIFQRYLDTCGRGLSSSEACPFVTSFELRSATGSCGGAVIGIVLLSVLAYDHGLCFDLQGCLC